MDSKTLYKNLIKAIKSNPDEIKTISKAFMKEHYNDKDYWKYIFQVLTLDDEFIKEYINDINLEYLLQYQNLSFSIQDWLEEHAHLSQNTEYLDTMVKFQTLSDSLLASYFNKMPLESIDWKSLAINQNLPDEIIDRYSTYWDWDLITQEQLLTLNIISKHQDKINWSLLPTNLKSQYLFNDSFVLVFENKPLWDNIGWMDQVSAALIFDMKDRLPPNGWYSVLEHKELPMELLLHFINEVMPATDNINVTECWKLISSFQALDDDFIDTYASHLNWDDLCMFQKLGWSVIEKHSDKVSLQNLSHNEYLTPELKQLIKQNQHLFKDEFDDTEDDELVEMPVQNGKN